MVEVLSRDVLARITRVYGLTAEEVRAVWEHQQGRCAICKKRFTNRTRVAAVDHDHGSGLVRGLLCRPCNWAIGERHDDLDWFEAVVKFLRTPPCGIALCGDRYVPGSVNNPREDHQ